MYYKSQKITNLFVRSIILSFSDTPPIWNDRLQQLMSEQIRVSVICRCQLIENPLASC